MYARVQAIAENVFGGEHRSVVIALDNRAKLLCRQVRAVRKF